MNAAQQPGSSTYHPKVFISYSHDSFEHISRVLALSDRLRLDGVDCNIDQYEIAPPRGWADWTETQIEESDFVIVVCTATYKERFKSKAPAGQGKGVKWEGAIIRSELYASETNNTKFVAVIFSAMNHEDVPSILNTYTYYNMAAEGQYESLYRLLTTQPRVIKPSLGNLRSMPPLERAPGFFATLEQGEDDGGKLPDDLHTILESQQKAVEAHSSRLVGREYVHSAFKYFMARHSRGYFILRGGPGQGKTAVSSLLIKAHGCIYYLITRTSRSQVRLVLRSLIAQISRLSQIKGAIYDSTPALVKTLRDLLYGLASLQQKVILVIDALDELTYDGEGELDFLLTDSLPEGVYVFVTSRPGVRLDKFEEQLSASPYEIHDLGPLEAAEAKSVVELNNPRLTEAQSTRLVKASHGNPLFLRMLADEVERDPAFDVRDLPSSIEGFFRRSTKDIRNSQNVILLHLLGVLSVARKHLTLPELSGILGEKQRDIYEQGINAIRPFLVETDGCYHFYHARFQDYVTHELLYHDELRDCHRSIANWLKKAENESSEYRLSSLGYHLFEAGDRGELYVALDQEFLDQKSRRLGYAVLEDLELLTNSMLETRDLALIGKTVDRVASLTVGERWGVARSLWSYDSPGYPFSAKLIEPTLPSLVGVDLYIGMLPRWHVSADFFEVIPSEGRLILAIGDAPSLGLTSAFVARFVGNLFRTTVKRLGPFHLDEALEEMADIISGHEYFNWVTMQCVEIDLTGGFFAIASAAHPFPVLYSARRARCDRLPVRGEILHSNPSAKTGRLLYEQRHAEIYPGDVLVMMTDGLLESQILADNTYGYGFTEIIEQMHGQSSEAIGRSILDDWSAHKQSSRVDDVTIMVVTFQP